MIFVETAGTSARQARLTRALFGSCLAACPPSRGRSPPDRTVPCRETCPTSACIGIHYPRRSAPGSLLFPRDLFWSTGNICGSCEAVDRRGTRTRYEAGAHLPRFSLACQLRVPLSASPTLFPPPSSPLRPSARLLGPLLSSAVSYVSLSLRLISSTSVRLRCLFAGFSLSPSPLVTILPRSLFFHPSLFSLPSPPSIDRLRSPASCCPRANFLHSSERFSTLHLSFSIIEKRHLWRTVTLRAVFFLVKLYNIRCNCSLYTTIRT